MSDKLIELNEALVIAERELSALEAEQRAIPAKFSQAAQNVDASMLIELRQRADELGPHIFAAQVMVLRCKIAVEEVEYEVVKQAFDQCRAELAPLELKSKEAMQALEQKRTEIGRRQSLLSNHRDKVRRLRSEVDRMIDFQAGAVLKIV